MESLNTITTTSPSTQTPTPTDANDTQKTIESNVDANALNLTLSALSAALGDIRVLKLTVTNKNSLRYEVIKTDEEITKALEWIALYGNTKIFPSSEEDASMQYFILQQAQTNMSAWNALIDRNLGKVPNESKIDLKTTMDLEDLGQRAVEARRRLSIDAAVPAMQVPPSWTTVDE